jgi:hypothetical protein
MSAAGLMTAGVMMGNPAPAALTVTIADATSSMAALISDQNGLVLPIGSWLTVPAAGALLVRPMVRTFPAVCVAPAGVLEEIPDVVLVPPGWAGACPPPEAAAAGLANISDAVDSAAPMAMAKRFNGLSFNGMG